MNKANKRSGFLINKDNFVDSLLKLKKYRTRKYKPITAGFTIQNCSVKSAHVLVYREQHGYEIKYPSFLTQFNDAKIDSTLKLNTKIDNISAATLSVNSMKRMAKMALLLSKLSNENSCT